MPILLNRARGYQGSKDIIKIDRSGPWGNPFIMGEDGDREEVCEKHKDWLNEWIEHKKERIVNGFSNKWVVTHLYMLKGKDLACWCVPSKCHGEILMKLSNMG